MMSTQDLDNLTLREQRKLERRDAIVRAAEKVMADKGYARATMDEIAAEAGVGVATVYKHFGTKANILEAIIRPSLDLSFAQAEKTIAHPPADPAAAMVALIENYRHLRNGWKERRLLRVLSVLEAEEVAVLKNMTSEANARAVHQIRDLLLVLKGRGDIRGTLAVEDAAFVIFCVFNQHYELFIADENIAFDKLFADLRRRIRLLMTAWTSK